MTDEEMVHVVIERLGMEPLRCGGTTRHKQAIVSPARHP